MPSHNVYYVKLRGWFARWRNMNHNHGVTAHWLKSGDLAPKMSPQMNLYGVSAPLIAELTGVSL